MSAKPGHRDTIGENNPTPAAGGSLDPEDWAGLSEQAHRMDFGLNQRGEILLFEANATMVVEQPDGDPCWDYRRAAVERIHAAVRDLLLTRAGAKRTS